MVRETRHLWIGNLPHTIREDRILDHFKRYGKVQSVKILPKKDDESGSGGACATVAFIDIKSAAKAHNADNKIEERTLKTDYYEAPASSTASSAIFIHERDDALVARNPAPPPPPAPYANSRNARYGVPDERTYERPAHYYGGEREPYLRRAPIGMGYHDEDSYQGRAKSRDRYVRSGTGSNYAENSERNQNHFRTHNSRQLFEPNRYSEQYNDERDVVNSTTRLNRNRNGSNSTSNISAPPGVSNATSLSPPPPGARSNSRPRRATPAGKRRSPSRTPSGSRSNSVSRSRSRSSSGSRSSSSSSKLRSSSSDSSGSSRSPSKSRSPVTYGSQSNAKRTDRPASAIANPSNIASSYLPSSISSAINCSPLVNSQCSTPTLCSNLPILNDCMSDRDDKRPMGICVRNLPVRSTDSSLKDGLFHEYKKHGKVTIVKVFGQGPDRFAVVCFKKPEDVDKALEVSKDKLFFGCKIEVSPHEGLEADDNEYRPFEAELDEYHPKATRTLFIGNLEKDITTAELRKHFEQFGEIIEIDIKKQGSSTSYAFIQYADISSVVKAMRKLDGENLGANRIKLGFGKNMPTNCVWLDGIVDAVSDKYLCRHFSRYGNVVYCAIDREKNHALIFYDTVESAQIAVGEMRGRILTGKKLQVDFASRECQTIFFDKLEMTGQMVPGDRPWEQRNRRPVEFEIRAEERDTRVGFENRVYTRYEGQTRTNRGSFRGMLRAGFCGRGRAQNFPPARYEVYHDEFGERRHRYNSRDDSGSEISTFDNKVERLKYDALDCNSRKRNKLRNSMSDQESHLSISPPRSRHQSRSSSPVSKDNRSAKTIKDRLHHRIKSPGSHNSSQVSSPCRESATEDPSELDYRDFRLKSSSDTKGVSDPDLPSMSPKNSLIHDGLDRTKTDSETPRRKSIDSESVDENSLSTSEQLTQLERKKRLLAAAASSLSAKDGVLLAPKVLCERFKLKGAASHSILNKVNCVSDSAEEEGGEGHDEIVPAAKDKPSANSKIQILQKKQVHLLHLLEQLHDNVNSSDTEGSLDNDRFSRKKRVLSSCVESLYSDVDIAKAVTKEDTRLLKEQLECIAKKFSNADSVESNNCFALSLDNCILTKHLDPRKTEYSLSSLSKCRRISLDKDETTGDSLEMYLKKGESLFEDDSLKALDLIKTLGSLTEGSLEAKRERDSSPLSLPLPKFAASLRSPKSSPSVATSPKSIAQSPRAVHSPNSLSSGKSVKIPDILDSQNDRKADEKLNGLNISPTATSPTQTDDITCLEPIQSPKVNPEKITITSDLDSETTSPISSPNRPSIEDRIKALDEKFNAWSGSSRIPGTNAPDTSPTLVIETPKTNIKKRSRFNYLTPDMRVEPSDIVKSLLSKSTIFDQDSMRLQHIDEKYEPVSHKTELSPKIKPTFRTKAAAKEFSPIAASSLPTFVPSLPTKMPPTAAGTITSPPENNSMANSVLSPITPPTPHFTQGSSQLYTPCSPCVASFPSCRDICDNPSTATDTDLPGDQAGLAPKIYSASMKVKNDPIIATSMETASHGVVATSIPVSVKKDSLCLKENFQSAIKDALKKELSPTKPNIPTVKDYHSSHVKDQVVYKVGIEHSKKELPERPSVSLKDGWKSCESINESSDLLTRLLPTADLPDSKLSTKKRVLSVDSSESESGKLYKSAESNRDTTWSKQDKEKSDGKGMEPECKKSKLSLPHNALHRSQTSVSSFNKKIDKKEKSSKFDKPRPTNFKKLQSSGNHEKEESDSKVVKSEVKEKPKSDTHKSREEKKIKSSPKEHKDCKNEQRPKSTDKKQGQTSVEKESKLSNSLTPKPKKEHSNSNRSSEKSKSDKKSSEKKPSKSKSKQQQQDFDFILKDEPVYFSMYDKVKARSSKQQTIKHQEKDLESMRKKFNKLKQSRAKREDKSKSIDSDRDSDSASQHSSDSETKTSKPKQQRKRKLVIESSSEDENAPKELQNRSTKNDKKDFSDSASDSDFDHKMHQKQLSAGKNRKKKADIIESDSSDSNFAPLLKSQQMMMMKKKSKLKNITQERMKKMTKSEDETSDLENKSCSKEKEHRRKKLKKSKNYESKSERDNSTPSSHKKTLDENKMCRKKLLKEDRFHSSDSLLLSKHEDIDNASRERKPENDLDAMDIEESEKYKSFNKKKKKSSKKTSKSKDKRLNTDRRSSEFTSRKEDESESKSSLPILLSPRPNSPLDDKPLSPPCLRAGDASDNDFKSNASDNEFDLRLHLKNLENDKNRLDIKTETLSEKNARKKEHTFSPTKFHASDFFDSDRDSLVTFPEKLLSKPLEKLDKEHSVKSSNHNTDSSRKKVLQSSLSSKKSKELAGDHHKTKHEESSSFVKHSESKAFDNYAKEDKNKKKIKKPNKDKKWKPKSEEMKDSEKSIPMRSASPLLFETVSFDNDSRLSDLRIDEEIAKEARRLEQELLAASEETSTFGDDSPIIKKEEKLAERKFEEEAAKETQRLEAELFSTGRESWHMKEKSFGPELLPEELCVDGKELCESILKEEDLFSTLTLHSASLGDVSQHESDIFLSGHSAADQYKLEDKDVIEIDDQRKIEDDLAVSALLQEMNSGDISAPELTKETDYLEPLLNTQQPEDTMNYMIPDDGDNSLHIVDESSELLMNECSDERLDNDIPLSPSSNSEPPPLEISTFEDSVPLKNYNINKADEDHKVDLKNKSFTTKSVIEHGHEISCSSVISPNNKPPIIDIPAVTLHTGSCSPQDRKKLPRKSWVDRSQRLSSHDLSNQSEHSERNSEEFEDITMDTKDNKDDDNPPVLLPVDLPPRLESAASESPSKIKSASITPNRSEAPFEPPLSYADSVIVRAPEVENPLQTTKQTPESVLNAPSSIPDYNSNSLTPIKAPSYSQEIKNVAMFKNTHVLSKNTHEIDIPTKPNYDIATTSATVTTTTTVTTSALLSNSTNSWKSSDMDVAGLNVSSVPKLTLEDHSISSPMLYYSDLFKRKDSSSHDEVKKCDASSVIKSTAVLNLLPPDKPKVSPSIPSENFIHSVFNSNTDNRGVVIFNTSQLTKSRENTEMQHLFNYDQKYKDIFNNNLSNKEKVELPPSVTKDPFDALQAAPKPPSLHFEPLFTIPTTEPLLSPSNDKINTEDDDNSDVKNDKEPSKVENEPKDEIPPADDIIDSESTSKQHSEECEISSLADTLSKINEKLDNEDKKSKSADVESVSSDTTDIAFPDTKSELDMNPPTSSEEQAQDEMNTKEEEVVTQKKSQRTRRGRRPRTRSKKNETIPKDEIEINPPIKTKRTQPASSERSRRSLRRGDALEQVIDAKIESKSDSIVSLDSEDDTRKSNSLDEVKVVEPTKNETSLADPQIDKVYHTRSDESKKRRGRKKRANEQQVSQLEDTSHHSSKDLHRPKDRVWQSLSAEKEQTSKVNPNAMAIFDFSEEEEELDQIKKGLRDITKANAEPKPEVKLIEPPVEKDKPDDQKLLKPPAEEPMKEESVESKSPPRKRIPTLTLRSLQDGTAEVLNPPKVLPTESNKNEKPKSEKSAIKETTDSTHSGPSKSTRKSTRLMNQSTKPTPDETFDDKATFKGSNTPKATPSRMTRRSRASRKSKDNVTAHVLEDSAEEKNKNEPMFVIADNAVKDLPEIKKPKSGDPAALSEQAISSAATNLQQSPCKSNVALMRAFRWTRSISNKQDAQAETGTEVSESSTTSRKDSTNSSTSDDEQKDLQCKKQTSENEHLPLPPIKLSKKLLSSITERCAQKLEKDEEDIEEDVDSRMYLDPATGVFTAFVKKKDTLLEKSGSNSDSNVTARSATPTSTPVLLSKDNPEDTKLVASKPVTWDAKTINSVHVSIPKKDLVTPDEKNTQDTKAADNSNQVKTCAHVGVLTPVVSTTPPIASLPPKVVSTVAGPRTPASTPPITPNQVPFVHSATQENVIVKKQDTNVLSLDAVESCPQPSKSGEPLVTTNLPLKVLAKSNPIATAAEPLLVSSDSKIDILVPAAVQAPVHKNDKTEIAHNWSTASLPKDVLVPAVAINPSWSNSKIPSASQTLVPPAEIPPHLGAIQSHQTKLDGRVTQSPHVHAAKTAAYLQSGFPAAIYESAQQNLQSLGVNAAGGVITDLLQNPQLLQQHKEFLTAAANGGQFPDRNPNQLVRPPTPIATGIAEVTGRLGNPTPPRTPTPLNTSAHSPDVHMHLRQAGYPPPLGLPPSWDLNPFVASPIMYAPHYTMPHHPDIRTQQDVRARARFSYSAITPNAIPPGSFRQPLDQRLPHSPFVDHKSDGKVPSDLPDPSHDRRIDEKHSSKSRMKKKSEKEKFTDNHERVDKHSASTPRSQQHAHYPPNIRQLSPSERISDSPGVSLYAPGQARVPPLPDQMKDLKADAAIALHQSHYLKADDRKMNPPAAHQPQVSSLPFHAYDSLNHAARQQLLAVHQPIRSPAPYVDNRPSPQPPGMYVYKKDHLPPTDKQLFCDVPKEVLQLPVGHQDASVSPNIKTPPSIPTPQNIHGINQLQHPLTAQNEQIEQRSGFIEAPDNLILDRVQCDQFIAKKHPVMWQGLLALKNQHAAVQMHFVSGNRGIALASLPESTLRIAQRMKLEPAQLDGVARKMQMIQEHCILAALPCGKDHPDVIEQSRKLQTGFIEYLMSKQAAGIVNAAAPDSQQPAYVIHIFPPSDFSDRNLQSFAPQLSQIISGITHLVIVIATV